VTTIPGTKLVPINVTVGCEDVPPVAGVVDVNVGGGTQSGVLMRSLMLPVNAEGVVLRTRM
jgi:hypothetical protein